ncbi:hypothetical protein A3I34_00810 [Candidatus Jorgensenbacteria bacterium RIFCSPLOWO2_02_FULL_45_12]|uniref:Adenylate kinase n=1 Tax=Candidatus Jorgensenbacteria bacterium RIFCSPHIGHO2_02_FULL_45_20 TaxID=1798470 RepID=A0A1F6BPR8_9BACT|nr:MAG: hypothetical protein A3D55_02530 [Candidatus Jorgensenbacteria bacterium RIFCSPHIGHO2_02_FULL_45_20]OGG42229.1 MAG: hypothetical protein A3I34_00810 [Candidatus Jorgensenbacteria bacterium RIFCSPLOWO2_02_FULL_45_12]
MNNFNFSVPQTKIGGKSDVFLLEDPKDRKRYFSYKAGQEIEKIREFLRHGSFMAFLLGPKNSGKGTYSKLFAEAVGSERIRHISVGDIVRGVHMSMDSESGKNKLFSFLEANYRGPLSISDAVDSLLGRNASALLPTEFILALLKKEIKEAEGKAIFVDGFPRNLDQISYSLYFRTLMGYEDNPDFFVFIDVPENIIIERIKNRVVCPKCHVPRSLRLLKTKEVVYDAEEKKFYLICDNPVCGGPRMVEKEGDSLGIEVIRDRVEMDKKVIETLINMHGIPKIYLRNSVPVSFAKESVDDYEITPAYSYEFDTKNNRVAVSTSPWVINDDEGVPSYSLLPAPIVVSLIRQVVSVLNL